MIKFKDYEYEERPIAFRESHKTWRYRILKDKKTFYYRFVVSDSLEKAIEEGDSLVPKIKEAIDTNVESLVQKYLDQELEEDRTWILELEDIRPILGGVWPGQSNN